MRKTVILVILAIALGAYVYFYEIRGGEKRDKEKEISEKLFSMEKDSIQVIKIFSPQGDFHFIRTPDGWQLEQPVKTQADESPINSLLSTLSNSKKERSFIIAEADKNQYGLGRWATRLYFESKDGTADSVRIGEKTNIGANIYVSNIDTVVHLVSQSLKTNAEKSLFDWRDKKPIHFKKDEVREFTLSNPQGSFTFIKDGSEWNLIKPIETNAEKSSVDAVLNKLDFNRIKSVLAEESSNLSGFGLDNPAYAIDLSLGAEKAKTRVIFSEVKDNVSNGKDSARPIVYTVDSTFIQPFKKDLFGFRDKKIIEFENDDITRLNLSHNNQVMTFVKDTSDNWTLNTGEKAKQWKINSLLSTIRNLKAEKFVEENPRFFMNYGLVNPESRIELFAESGLVAELNLGFERDDFIYVYNPAFKPIVIIKKEKIKELFPLREDMLEETKPDEERAEE